MLHEMRIHHTSASSPLVYSSIQASFINSNRKWEWEITTYVGLVKKTYQSKEAYDDPIKANEAMMEFYKVIA